MKAIIIAIALTATTAQADSWKGKDKDGHAIAGAAVGIAATAVTKNAWAGCAAASTVGLAKEVYDAQNSHRHTVSFKDFAVTAAAGCISAGATNIIISKEKVIFSWRF